jgi:integrase
MSNSYHIFRKSKKTTDGKTFYRWYYYYTDNDGKKHQKACKDCRNRSEADSYIKPLPALAPGANSLVKDIAADMYLPGSAHINRRIQLGKTLNIETLVVSRRYLEEIIKLWGNTPLKDIDAETVINHLITVNRSGSWKNRFLSVLKEIWKEAPRHGCKAAAPVFPRFASNSKKADTFTGAELSQLFKPENFPDSQYFIFFLLILSAGLRLGEARAVKVKQILFDKKALIIDGFCKNNGERTMYNKKGSPDNPKLRAARLPDFTLDLLSNYLNNRVPALFQDDYLFNNNGAPIKQETAEVVFTKALIYAGIGKPKKQLIEEGIWKKGQIMKKTAVVPGGRKLVPHSLRYTYVSRMRFYLSAADLQPMTGHTTESMVNYYNRPCLEDILKNLPKAENALAGLLDFNSGAQ